MIARLNILCLNYGNSRTGAPILFIKLLQFLKNTYGVNFTIITTSNGALLEEFKSTAKTYQWDGWVDEKSFLNKFYFLRLFKRIIFKIFRIKKKSNQDNIIDDISKQKFNLVYANSVTSLLLLGEINKKIFLNCKTVLHIHELEIAISQFSNLNALIESRNIVNHYIAVSAAVKNELVQKYGINEKLISIIYGGVETKEKINYKESDFFTICGAGTLDWRKGIDIFIQLASLVKEDHEIRFLWIGGDLDSLDYRKAMYDIQKLKLSNIILTGEVNNPIEYMTTSNVFVLTSREDPFPLVCLEAASVGKPIICFDQAGGMPEFVSNECGYIVPYLSIQSIKEKIYYLKENNRIAQKLGNNAYERMNKYHRIDIVAPQLMKLFEETVK
jgi:glycosyltransferase involved in cell wall biosynthesis